MALDPGYEGDKEDTDHDGTLDVATHQQDHHQATEDSEPHGRAAHALSVCNQVQVKGWLGFCHRVRVWGVGVELAKGICFPRQDVLKKGKLHLSKDVYSLPDFGTVGHIFCM